MKEVNNTQLNTMSEIELKTMLTAIESMHPTGFSSALARESKIHNIKLELENRESSAKE